MRNTTKLKHLLLKYSLTFDMEDDTIFNLTLVDKSTLEISSFQGKAYATVLEKAYRYMLKEIRTETKGLA